MVVDPKTGVIFVWTKEPRSLGVVHRLEDLRTGGVGRAVAIKQIHPPTGNAGLPTGVEDILEATPVQVPARIQRQSEAISYTHDGRGYVLGTEGASGPIYAVGCDDAADGSSRSSS
ncbi:MAG: hypothetical protein P8R42_25725 [Candidatus Binatia bacterium]|nr:hypothetical protein [Candidatus Binatia bacterium]